MDEEFCADAIKRYGELIREETAEKVTEPAEETVAEEKTEEKEELTREEQLENEIAALKDKLMRTAAEFDNFKKRTAKEKEEIHAMSKVTILSELLPVTDNLERALNNTADNVEDYKKGVEMIAKQLMDCFKKLGAESFGEVGDEFDPNLHNAVMHIDDENLGENVVAEVFSKGYKTGDRVIRCAVVKVAN